MNSNHHNQRRFVLTISILLSVLISVASCVGLFTPGFYSAETINWQAQAIGQDLIDLILVVPALLISSLMNYRGNKTAALIWTGTILYLIYTFLIYCFDVHFNKLFIIYCFILGISFYSLIYFFSRHLNNSITVETKRPAMAKVTGIYFLIISVMFYFLWLSEIIPAIVNNSAPKTLTESGLFTNPVQVLDLSIVLPGIFITGVLLLRKKQLGYILAPILLTFFILMTLTIMGLMIVLKQRGLKADLQIPAIMGVLTLVSALLFIRFSVRSKANREKINL